MSKTALSREDHRDVSGVAAVNDIPIADGTARLDNGGDAFADADLGAVTEREERIGHHAAPGQSAALRLDLVVNLRHERVATFAKFH